MNRDVPREGDDVAFPPSQMKRFGGARSSATEVDIRHLGVDSRGLAAADDEDGYVVEEEIGMRSLAAALAPLAGKPDRCP
jgi:hypothetical protein